MMYKTFPFFYINLIVFNTEIVRNTNRLASGIGLHGYYLCLHNKNHLNEDIELMKKKRKTSGC